MLDLVAECSDEKLLGASCSFLSTYIPDISVVSAFHNIGAELKIVDRRLHPALRLEQARSGFEDKDVDTRAL
jgi:hypothetical protein